MKKHFLIAGIAALMLAACNNKPASELTLSGLDPAKFQTEVNNAQTALYTLKNKAGMEVCITNFGGRIVSIMVPDKNGKMQDVVLGFDSIADYINVPSDFGASIGRYANRINQGRFVLDGDTIQLPQNNFGHCLHGGPKGWQYQVYEANLIDPTTLELTLISPDGDANFPGNVTAKVTYQLTDDNAIDIKYSATTDKKTIINMTNHSYFNLAGDPSKTSTDNIMYVNADYYTPVDSTFMTTGEIAPVKDTPMDFTTPKAVGKDINNYDFVQLKNGNGYDHNWVLNTKGDISQVAARLTSPETGDGSGLLFFYRYVALTHSPPVERRDKEQDKRSDRTYSNARIADCRCGVPLQPFTGTVAYRNRHSPRSRHSGTVAFGFLPFIHQRKE